MCASALALSWVAAALLSGCVEDAPAPCQDQDQDGVCIEDDCDDADAGIFPGATEVCDGVDNDCDGAVDGALAVDAETWQLDQDGDGYGDPRQTALACEGGPGLTTDASDCDDADASVYPGAADAWYDGVDADCAGDDDFDADLDGHASDAYTGDDCDDTDASVHPGAADAWYDGQDVDCAGNDDFDADGDGHASDAYAGDDCDDADASVYPGAPETWYDGVDGDCAGGDDFDADADGLDDAWEVEHGLDPGRDDAAEDPDLDGLSNAEEALWGTEPLVADSDGDGLDDGVEVELGTEPLVADTDGDGVSDGAEASSDHDPLEPGWWWDSPDLSAADAVMVDARSTWHFVAFGGDMDGDGHDEVLVGARYASDARGVVYVAPGPIEDGMSLFREALRLEGDARLDMLGDAVAGVGDVDGDGYDDVLFGMSQELDGGPGAAFLVHGPLAEDATLDDAAAWLVVDQDGAMVGTAVAGGADLTGDAVVDLVVSAPHYMTDSGYGAVFLVSGDAEGSIELDAEATVVHSGADGWYFGGMPGYAPLGAAIAGDIDGDGAADLVVGDWYREGDLGSAQGAAFLFLGPVADGTLASEADAVRMGEGSGDYAGWAVAAGGDLDGDGHDDLLVSACAEDTYGDWAGAAYVLSGPVEGRASLSTADARLYGDDGGVTAGFSLAGGFDGDVDGHDDLIVGVPCWAPTGGECDGAAYLVQGPVEGSHLLEDVGLRVSGEGVGAYAGWSVAAGGDVDADGRSDMLVGASWASGPLSGEGAVYVLRGFEL